MTALDLDFIRGQFPAFAEPSLQGFAHFENAGGSYTSRQTIDRLDHYYRRPRSSPTASIRPRGGRQAMDLAHHRMAQALNVGSDWMHFGPSTSHNTFHVAQRAATDG